MRNRYLFRSISTKPKCLNKFEFFVNIFVSTKCISSTISPYLPQNKTFQFSKGKNVWYLFGTFLWRWYIIFKAVGLIYFGISPIFEKFWNFQTDVNHMITIFGPSINHAVKLFFSHGILATTNAWKNYNFPTKLILMIHILGCEPSSEFKWRTCSPEKFGLSLCTTSYWALFPEIWRYGSHCITISCHSRRFENSRWHW